MSWSNTSTSIQIGDDVYGSDGEKVGTVAEVQPTYLVVEKGFFFPTDYYIPLSAITQVTDGQVWLTVSKESALHSGWERVPEDTASMATGERIMAGEHGWDLASEVTATDRVLDQAAAGQSVQAGYEATSEEDLVIPLREEELTASVRETEAGAARIHKRVVAEDRVLEVPVTEEQIRVERRVVDRPAETGAADAFEEIVIEVPLIVSGQRQRVNVSIDAGILSAIDAYVSAAGTTRSAFLTEVAFAKIQESMRIVQAVTGTGRRKTRAMPA